MPRALITGITGQDGRYLAELLASKDYEVFGLIHGTGNPREAAVREAVSDVRLVPGDVTDLPSILQALQTAAPDEVYNLAAISSVAYSWQHAARTTDVTAKGVLNVLEALRISTGPDAARTRFYQASSSEMFGKTDQVPQDERTPFWPRSPYGVAKAFGHYTTINYRESYGLHASSGILFNHESPRRPADFVMRKVTCAVAAIAAGKRSEIVLGNLDVRRDWGFAGDYVEAMWLMLQQPEPDDYVIATGVSHSIRDLLDSAFRAAGIGDWARYVRHDPQLLRPADIETVVGNPAKARDRLGWRPRLDFDELVALMVEHDLRRVGRSRSHPSPSL